MYYILCFHDLNTNNDTNTNSSAQKKLLQDKKMQFAVLFYDTLIPVVTL